MAEMSDYWLYSMNAPFGRTRVLSPTNLKMCDRTKPNLDSTHELRGCAQTVRSSSKVCNPTFQPLIGTQEPPLYGVVPVIKIYEFYHFPKNGIANFTNLAASRFYFLVVESLLSRQGAALRGGTTRRARRRGRGPGGRGVHLAWDTSSPHPRA